MKKRTIVSQSLEKIKDELREATGKSVDWNAEKFTSEARKQIANKFVDLYFVLLVLSFIVPVVYNLLIYWFTKSDVLFLSLKDIVLLITSTLGGPLGFIVGFYFKDK